MENSYEFDPCSIEENNEDEEVSLDNWKPRKKEKTIIQSEWRKNQIGNDFNQQPGLDDLNKIQMYLKKNRPDAEIMKAFGVSAEMLVAIKKENYSPVEGISCDNLSKIQNEFKKINKTIMQLKRGVDYITKAIFQNKNELNKFKEHVIPTKKIRVRDKKEKKRKENV